MRQEQSRRRLGVLAGVCSFALLGALPARSAQTVPPGTPVTLEFNAAANKSYTVEVRNDLTFGSWTTLQNIDPGATPRAVRVTDGSPLNTRFYRVRSPRGQ